MIGLNPKAVSRVTIDADVEANGKGATVFLVRAWTVEQESRVRAAILREKETTTDAQRGDVRYEAIIEVLRQSLAGWENFNDAAGAAIAFSAAEIDQCIAAIPFWARSELASKILDANWITGETVGKSVPSSEGATAT
jgi:hypothetical protein